MSYVGAIDQGTSSTRFILFDKNGAKVASAQTEITNHYPQAGWVEHDPLELLSSVHACIERVMKDYPASSVKSIGITNQRETSLVWDKTTGKPLFNAIVWLDTRTRTVVEKLVAQCGSADHYRALVGLPISTYFSGLKLKWLMENVPAVQQAVSKGTALFGTVDSWLLWNLTGGVKGGQHITSVCNASRTFLMNINSLQWSPEVCRDLGIPMTMLPRICSNSEVYGSMASGPLSGVPLGGCLGDQQAALLGQQCFDAGQAKNTYGTGCFMLLNTGTRAVQSKNGLLTTVAFQLGKHDPCRYALEGSIAVAGVGVTWLRDNLQLIKDPSDMDGLVNQVDSNDGVYCVPAFSGLLSPYWRSDARGVLTGLTLQSTKAHIARALLEATAYQTRDVLNAMVQDSASAGEELELSELRVDGGLTNSSFLMQFQSDLLGIKVVRPSMMECTAAGSAFAAGLAVGFWASEADLKACITTGQFTTFKPEAAPATMERLFRGWKRAVTKSFNLAGDPPEIVEERTEERGTPAKAGGAAGQVLAGFALLAAGIAIGLGLAKRSRL